MFLEGPAMRISTCKLKFNLKIICLRWTKPNKKKSFIFSSRLRPCRPSSESQQHPSLYPEPEGDWQPAQTHPAIKNNRMLGYRAATVLRLKTVAYIWTTELIVAVWTKPPRSSEDGQLKVWKEIRTYLRRLNIPGAASCTANFKSETVLLQALPLWTQRTYVLQGLVGQFLYKKILQHFSVYIFMSCSSHRLPH